MNNKFALLFISVSLLSTLNTAFADETVLERPSFSASQTMTTAAEVEAIDYETRVVTLRRIDGEEIIITASDEVRNLAQVAVGDMLLAEYIETISIEVIANEGMEAAAAAASIRARPQEGEMPGLVAMDTAITTATVEEINIENNTFKLKEADGSINEYVARNPDNLKRAKVGDLVVTTVSMAVAMSVEKQAAE
jgi:hypothetical protein